MVIFYVTLSCVYMCSATSVYDCELASDVTEFFGAVLNPVL